MSNYVMGLYEKPAYLAGRAALVAGKHLIVPDGHAAEREAWILGWNDEWTDQNEREPS